MKKILITLMLLGAICANSFAQVFDVVETGEEAKPSKNNEVFVSAGTVSSMPVALTLITFGLITLSEGESWPVTFTAGYNYFYEGGHVGLGGLFSYEKCFGMDLLSLQARIIGQYGWERFKFYHSFSIGAMAVISDSANFIPTIDITLLGLKLDFDNFNVFAELSCPSTALVKVGASYKF